MPASKFSLIKALSELTGCTDNEIAQLTGLARSTVQAYRVARLEENLTEEQKAAILEEARNYRQQVYERVAEMELFS